MKDKHKPTKVGRIVLERKGGRKGAQTTDILMVQNLLNEMGFETATRCVTVKDINLYATQAM